MYATQDTQNQLWRAKSPSNLQEEFTPQLYSKFIRVYISFEATLQFYIFPNFRDLPEFSSSFLKFPRNLPDFDEGVSRKHKSWGCTTGHPKSTHCTQSNPDTVFFTDFSFSAMLKIFYGLKNIFLVHLINICKI